MRTDVFALRISVLPHGARHLGGAARWALRESPSPLLSALSVVCVVCPPRRTGDCGVPCAWLHPCWRSCSGMRTTSRLSSTLSARSSCSKNPKRYYDYTPGRRGRPFGFARLYSSSVVTSKHKACVTHQGGCPRRDGKSRARLRGAGGPSERCAEARSVTLPVYNSSHLRLALLSSTDA